MHGILEFWYLFPISVVIATIAIASGIGGAVFFSPIFMLVLKVEPFTAIGAGLITELFGFSSGLYGYKKRKLIAVVRVLGGFFGANYDQLLLIGKIFLFTAPGVLIGGQIEPFLQQKTPPKWMKLFISVLLVIVGLFLLYTLMI